MRSMMASSFSGCSCLGLLMSTNPWDVPEREPVGDSDPEPLYRSVGKVLSAWESLEIYRGWFFMLLCRTKGGSSRLVPYSAPWEYCKTAGLRSPAPLFDCRSRRAEVLLQLESVARAYACDLAFRYGYRRLRLG